MNTASLQEIKKELRTLDSERMQALCLRLAKYKKENKELLNYLLFEAHNEHAFIENVKADMVDFFASLPATRNVYLVKKSLRKILRFATRQIKYSGIKQTELELRIFFCVKMKETKIPLYRGTVLYNLYQQQLKKIESAFAALPEDVRADYDRELNMIAS